MRKGFKKALSFVLSAAMMVSLGSGLDIAPASAADGAAGTGNTPAASTVTYGAMVAFQTNSYDSATATSRLRLMQSTMSGYRQTARRFSLTMV